MPIILMFWIGFVILNMDRCCLEGVFRLTEVSRINRDPIKVMTIPKLKFTTIKVSYLSTYFATEQ